MASGNFGGLALSAPVMRAPDELGFEEPTPIRARAIPPPLEGRNVVAQALTGTGKTAALGIPLRNASTSSVTSRRRLSSHRPASSPSRLPNISAARTSPWCTPVPIYGGQPIDRQLRAPPRRACNRRYTRGG